MHLKDYLTEKNLKPAQFARLGPFHKTSVSLWLAGKRRPDAESIERIRQVTRNAVGLKDWVKSSKRESKYGGESKRTTDVGGHEREEAEEVR